MLYRMSSERIERLELSDDDEDQLLLLINSRVIFYMLSLICKQWFSDDRKGVRDGEVKCTDGRADMYGRKPTDSVLIVAQRNTAINHEIHLNLFKINPLFQIKSSSPTPPASLSQLSYNLLCIT